MKDSGDDLGSWYAVNVYADGRLIWSRQVEIIGAAGWPIVPRWIEQRLTPEGVELLRSGAVSLGGQFENPAQGLPASAWEDRTLRPFVPWRYAACLTGDPVGVENSIRRFRVAQHGSIFELVVFQRSLTAVHHHGVELERTPLPQRLGPPRYSGSLRPCQYAACSGATVRTRSAASFMR